VLGAQKTGSEEIDPCLGQPGARAPIVLRNEARTTQRRLNNTNSRISLLLIKQLLLDISIWSGTLAEDMSTSANTNAEILIHITAPSKGKDDTRYRALAQAYLDFEPIQRLELVGEHKEGLDEDETALADSQLQAELLQSTQEERESEASYRPIDEPESAALSTLSTQDRVFDHALALEGVSSQLSFSGVEHNLNSPAFKWPVGQSELPVRSQESEDSWVAPPSTIADSQPQPQREVGRFLSPTRALESILFRLQSSGQASSPEHTSSVAIDQSAQLPVLRNKGISTIPDSYVARPDQLHSPQTPSSPSRRKRARTHSLEILQTRSPNIYSTQENAVYLKGTESMLDQEEIRPSSSAPSKLEAGISIINATASETPRKRIFTEKPRVTTSEVFTSSKATEVATPSPSNVKPIWASTIEIYAPNCRIGVDSLNPESFITESLKKIAKRKRIVPPLERKRELRPMERGHWHLNCQSFDAQLRMRCWEKLGGYVSSGLGGWGVSCHRDEDWTTMKLYCWGNMVDHLYLLLYCFSENKIKGTGACWKGGDGQDIIIME